MRRRKSATRTARMAGTRKSKVQSGAEIVALSAPHPTRALGTSPRRRPPRSSRHLPLPAGHFPGKRFPGEDFALLHMPRQRCGVFPQGNGRPGRHVEGSRRRGGQGGGEGGIDAEPRVAQVERARSIAESIAAMRIGRPLLNTTWTMNINEQSKAGQMAWGGIMRWLWASVLLTGAHAWTSHARGTYHARTTG